MATLSPETLAEIGRRKGLLVIDAPDFGQRVLTYEMDAYAPHAYDEWARRRRREAPDGD